jgi:hypothetical protein
VYLTFTLHTGGGFQPAANECGMRRDRIPQTSEDMCTNNYEMSPQILITASQQEQPCSQRTLHRMTDLHTQATAHTCTSGRCPATTPSHEIALRQTLPTAREQRRFKRPLKSNAPDGAAAVMPPRSQVRQVLCHNAGMRTRDSQLCQENERCYNSRRTKRSC